VTRLRHPHRKVGTVTLNRRKHAPRAVYARILAAADSETRTAAEWVGTAGRARKLRAARVTAAHACQVGAVVCVHAREMKEPWCLAASDPEAPAAMLIKQYARRWTIEPRFRDTKDLRFGMGMAELRIAEPERRDRLLLISACAMALLTMLGAAGESLGMDPHESPHFRGPLV